MFDTLTDLIRSTAATATSQGFRFLRDGKVVDAFTYAELDKSAQAIAARMQAAGVGAGTPVLLLYGPGLEFVRALFACSYAGAIAVPVYPPNPARLARTLPRLRAITRDVEAKHVLTTAEIHAFADAVIPFAPELAPATWIATDAPQTEHGTWKPVQQRASDVAILQYTSGSTREPRGVVLSHANILHNQRLIQEAFAHTAGPDNMVVSWLPPYHDMGLIGMTLQPVFLGGSCVQMAPLEFLQHPHRWLAAVSEFRATTTGAPNFGFELCNRKVTDEQIAGLDLSSWRVAYCGAEPIRKDSLERFASRMERAGFRRSALLPCYGLAEATLIVSGTSRREGVVALDVDDRALREGRIAPTSDERATSLVGCGHVVGGQDVAIVGEGLRRPPNEIGEIWVRGDSIARGYWRNESDSAETFGALLADGTGPFLRTGDLGFLDATGELFVVGRVKDLLIVRGLNYYPHDLEATAESAWASLRPGCSAAFAVASESREEIVILCEYDAKAAKPGVSWDAVTDAVRAAVGVELELALDAIVLVAAGHVPKTSSGKVQRSEARRRFLAGELEVLHHAKLTPSPQGVPQPATLETRDDITRFITSWLSETLKCEVGSDVMFSTIGLDSLEAVRLIDTLGEILGEDLNPMLVMDFPSPSMLANRLATRR